MNGASNSAGSGHYRKRSVKYYSPTDLSKICRPNADYPSIRGSETHLKLPTNSEYTHQEKPRKRHEESAIEEKSRKKANKEKKKHKKGCRERSYCMRTDQEEVEKKLYKSQRSKKKEFSELNYYDLQCLMNDCNKDCSISSNIKEQRQRESKNHQRSHSVDQIPTKDVSSDQRMLRRPGRPRSAERKDIACMENNKEYYMKYYLPNIQNNSFQIYEQEQNLIKSNELISNQTSSKRNKDKLKNKRKTSRDIEIPEFVALDQINKQMMNIKDERFEPTIHYRWETEDNSRHHQQREFYGDYSQQQFRHNLDKHEHDLHSYKTSPYEYNEMSKREELFRTKTKERKKEQRKKTSDKEYKELKKYMKKLARGQHKESFNFTTENNVELMEQIQDERVYRDRKFLEENFLNLDLNQSHALRNTDSTKEYKHARKEFIPLELGELQMPPRAHRKRHDHKKNRNKKQTIKSESSERMRSANLSVKKKHTNLNEMVKPNDEQIQEDQLIDPTTKSETKIDSKINDKNIVCIYRNKDEKEETNTIKLTKKEECMSIGTPKKYTKKEAKGRRAMKEKDRSPYNKNQMVLPTEHDKQMADVLKMQERSLFFQEAMRKDFPTRPRPRLSRSRQRSSRYLVKMEDAQYNITNLSVDENPTKEVHCYDVGTSTILDNNFGDVLELLKGEPSMKTSCSNKRSVFHVKKKTSREDLVESSRKAPNDCNETLGIVVRGIEPPKKFETSKVRSRLKFPSEKNKINRLECKILSVVAIAPSKFNSEPDLEQKPTKAQSTPLMQHDTLIEKRNSDKRLERLLKYYKVEVQSKMMNQTEISKKSMKALFADKLSDYLVKLQRDDNDDILQFQTDDPKVVKLILPIDLGALQCSNSSGNEIKDNDQVAEKTKQSFSDLYINYTADNIDEDYDHFNSIESSKVENRSRGMDSDEPNLNSLISNQISDLKSDDQKSGILSNQSISNQMGSISEIPVSPAITGSNKRISPEFEVMQERQQSGGNPPLKQIAKHKLLDINTNTPYGREHYESPSKSEKPSFKTAENKWNYNTKTEQYSIRNIGNLEYKNSLLTNYPKSSDTNENEIFNANSRKELYSATSRRQNVVGTLGCSQPSEDSPKGMQQTTEPVILLAGNFEQVSPNSGDIEQIQSTSGLLPENIKKNINNPAKHPHQAAKQAMYEQKYKYSAKRENDRISSITNDGHIEDATLARNSNTQENMAIARAINSQPQNKPEENSPPTRRYEYFEIPPPRSKPVRKLRSDHENSPYINTKSPPVLKLERKARISPSVEQRPTTNSQIPKRILTNKTRNIDISEHFSLRQPQNENTAEQSNLRKARDEGYDTFFEPIETTTWNYQKQGNEIGNSVEKCLHWNIRNSETVVMSEFNDSTQNRAPETEKSTIVPRKSQIPVTRRDQNKFQCNQGRSWIGNENNTTMFLTKSYKVPPGQSSYEKRKMYDTRIRKNVKRRSLSESSEPTKMLPLIYEVRYCNIYNQCLPRVFDLGGIKSDQNLSVFSTDFDRTDLKNSIKSLTTAPSCYLAESKYEKVDLSTEPSCLLKESEYGQDTEQEPIYLSTEPSCLLKESRYDDTNKQKFESVNQLSDKIKQNHEETNFSSKRGRIKELIKENLLYSNYPIPNNKGKPATETRKRRNKVEKEKILSKTTLRCSKKAPRRSGKRLKIVAKLNDTRNEQDEDSSVTQDDSPQCQNLTKLSIDKVTENELCVSFEEQKLPPVENELVLLEKSVVSSSPVSEFSSDKESSFSSKSTLINFKVSSSITSEESKETVKELEVFITSAGDSGYLTKGTERNCSETGITVENTNAGKVCCSNDFEGFSSKPSAGILAEKNYKWNQKDLLKLRVQLLFPHVYDDFELLESARNTDLIKFYVESENTKLKEAIYSISQKEDMGTRSRSVISLPSVKMVPEEQSTNGDATSEYSYKSQQGGFFNYQKFIAQNNNCYSTKILSKLNKPGVCGDYSDTLEENEFLETCSVNSSLKTTVTTKKSLIELFKIRPSSAKRSDCSMLSDNDTQVGDCLSMKNNISDEEFLNNFHQIMALECQRYAKKVVDQSKTIENSEHHVEYEEIPLDCLLRNNNLDVESSEDYLEQEFQSDRVCNEKIDNTESTEKESIESFKYVTCDKQKTCNSKWKNLLKKGGTGSNSKFNLDFYPQEKMSILDMIKSVQVSSISEDSLICSPRDKVLSVISSVEVTKQSEKQFFDNLLAFYDKETEFIKKLIRDDEFFSSLIENIRNSLDATQFIFHKDAQKKMKKEKKRGILSRFFRWKEKKSTETIFENPSIRKSLEFAKSMSNESSSITRESCYSFYKDFEDLEKDINEAKHPNSEHLQQLAYKAKCHLEPMVKATISNRHISDKIKLAGFLKMLDMVSKGDFTFLNNGDNKTLEEKLREHVAQMFEKVYRIANREVVQKNTILDHDKIQLLKMLVTKYHMGIETHINILAIYIGRCLIVGRTQLEDAIIYMMSQDSQEINFEQLEKNCGIPSG